MDAKVVEVVALVDVVDVQATVRMYVKAVVAEDVMDSVVVLAQQDVKTDAAKAVVILVLLDAALHVQDAIRNAQEDVKLGVMPHVAETVILDVQLDAVHLVKEVAVILAQIAKQNV